MTATMTSTLATDKQLSFIKSLRKERYPEASMPDLLAMRAADAKLNKSEASKLISDLLAMKPVAAAAGTPVVVLATEKQVAFVVKLWGERYPESSDEALQAIKDAAPKLTKAEASKQISELLAIAKPVKAAEPETYIEPGVEYDPYLAVAKKGDVHVLDGEYIRIHVRQGSKKPYAARAKVIKHALWGTNDDGTPKLIKAGEVKWVTAYKLIYELSEATLATKEEAHAFGKMLGRCCFCSLRIDTPESVTAGFGPKCAANRGLAWGAAAIKIEMM